MRRSVPSGKSPQVGQRCGTILLALTIATTTVSTKRAPHPPCIDDTWACPMILSQLSSSARFQSSQTSFHDFPPRSSLDNPTTDEDLDRAYAAQQQSLLYESQDRILDGISGTVSTLKEQAGVMGREIFDQVGMLNDLESGIDASQGRLDRATKRMNDFIRKNKSEWGVHRLQLPMLQRVARKRLLSVRTVI